MEESTTVRSVWSETRGTEREPRVSDSGDPYLTVSEETSNRVVETSHIVNSIKVGFHFVRG